MDQSQRGLPRGRAGLEGALEFKSQYPKGHVYLGLIWAALVSQGHRMFSNTYVSLGVGGLFIWGRTLGCGCRDKTQDPPHMEGLAKARPRSE